MAKYANIEMRTKSCSKCPNDVIKLLSKQCLGIDSFNSPSLNLGFSIDNGSGVKGYSFLIELNFGTMSIAFTGSSLIYLEVFSLGPSEFY